MWSPRWCSQGLGLGWSLHKYPLWDLNGDSFERKSTRPLVFGACFSCYLFIDQSPHTKFRIIYLLNTATGNCFSRFIATHTSAVFTITCSWVWHTCFGYIHCLEEIQEIYVLMNFRFASLTLCLSQCLSSNTIHISSTRHDDFMDFMCVCAQTLWNHFLWHYLWQLCGYSEYFG